ncbi:glycosyltransferase [Marinimicrobium alkaliphilum]|uniref:glycosyltransferase n=1 Tax=Marinimicrobium alkaliphilum TaxID=2202654 RepID=UPI000DBA54D5|nr:glycosyltransferase [Marinimicrobium alkaliphilum]
MRILFIKHSLDRSELDMVMALHQRGVYIRVLALPGSLGSDQMAAEGIFIASKNYRSKISIPLISQIRGLIKYLKFDLLHCPESKGLGNAIFASYFTPVKIVAYRGTLARIHRTDPGIWLGLLHPKVNKIICVNQSIYDYLGKFFPDQKLMLNYKGYDVSWNQYDGIDEQPMPACAQDPDAFVVMYIAEAKNRPHKGLGTLVDAMHQLKSEQVHLIFIGSHDESVEKQALAGKAGARIHFMGMLPYAAQYLKYANTFVLPSTRDGFPRVIKEAMAEGLPVISTDIPGPNELVIDGETGLLVEAGSATAIATAIDTLAADPKNCRALGERGRQFLQDKFSTTAFTDKTHALYKALVG